MSHLTKAGYLLKKGELNKSWRVRWFTLEDDKLFYYKSPEQPKAISFIPLDQAVTRLCTENNGKDFCFEIITKQRVWQLVAKSHSEMNDWMKTLSVHTILHAENELIQQAEEMIAKVTNDQYLDQQDQENSAALKQQQQQEQEQQELYDEQQFLDENNNQDFQQQYQLRVSTYSTSEEVEFNDNTGS